MGVHSIQCLWLTRSVTWWWRGWEWVEKDMIVMGDEVFEDGAKFVNTVPFIIKAGNRRVRTVFTRINILNYYTKWQVGFGWNGNQIYSLKTLKNPAERFRILAVELNGKVFCIQELYISLLFNLSATSQLPLSSMQLLHFMPLLMLMLRCDSYQLYSVWKWTIRIEMGSIDMEMFWCSNLFHISVILISVRHSGIRTGYAKRNGFL